MNLTDPTKEQVWSQPLQVPSRSANDAHDTALLSSIQQQQQPPQQPQQPVDHSRPSRIKRSRKTRDDASSSALTTRAPATESEDSPTASPPLPLKPVFRLRPLSLDRGPIAPGLARPTAPFAKSERKKAFVSAIYYSECFLRDIRPTDADSAAFDIQNQYTKWWVQSKKSKPHGDLSDDNNNSSSNSTTAANKRRRLDPETAAPDAINSNPPPQSTATSSPMTQEQLTLLKERLLEHLQKTGGDTTTAEFQTCSEQLQSVYRRASDDTTTAGEDPSFCIDGTWLTLSKPTFSECQGRNEQGEYLYSLGRMSFDMFRPTHLKCSIRAVMNNCKVMDPKDKPQSFPHRLGKELQRHNKATAMSPIDNPIHHYDIVVAFTIEANQTRLGKDPTASSSDEFVVPRPIRGLMTNHGYMVADPNTPNRSSIWFSGGSIEVQDEMADGEVWKQIFDESVAPRRDMRAMANLLAAKVLLGAYTTTSSADADTAVDTSSDGNTGGDNDDSIPTMSYFFKRPIGGHGEVFCDALYVDETLRIMQGHRGSIFVFTRVPNCQDAAA